MSEIRNAVQISKDTLEEGKEDASGSEVESMNFEEKIKKALIQT